ncbi:MAG: ISL3 family transposase [Planctomycetia bacterium]|nr:ISL3 family transposase [Planctomycetia bacterium]
MRRFWRLQCHGNKAYPTGKKTVCGNCGKVYRTIYDRKNRRVRDLSSGNRRVYLELEIRRVFCICCNKVKQEKLKFLADNPFYTKRFAFYVGKRCNTQTIKDVAVELHLDWKTVKELEKQYMREKLRRAGNPGPKVIGIDEISIRKGHRYRIIVSDLERKRVIWFGGKDRSEESMNLFYDELGVHKTRKIRLAVMDMWKAFENAIRCRAPQATILYDKFHIIKHLNDALDKVRKSEYARLSGKDRKFIKGQKYTLLSHRENLTVEGRKALKILLTANKRLNTAYVLKETFGQLWSYTSEAWARKFFDNWKASLKWQRLKPYEEFAELVERHWDGIAAFCKPENKVPLGFVEGLNNKIRVIQRRAYGLRDEEYLRLKILACMLPDI